MRRLVIIAAFGGGVAAACAAWSYGTASARNPVQLTLDAKHTGWLTLHCESSAARFRDSGAVLQECIAEARKADPDVVFGTARCVGGKKQKVDTELLVDGRSMAWLSGMQQKYDVTDISKAARIILDFNMQEVDAGIFSKPQQVAVKPANDACGCGQHHHSSTNSSSNSRQ